MKNDVQLKTDLVYFEGRRGRACFGTLRCSSRVKWQGFVAIVNSLHQFLLINNNLFFQPTTSRFASYRLPVTFGLVFVWWPCRKIFSRLHFIEKSSNATDIRRRKWKQSSYAGIQTFLDTPAASDICRPPRMPWEVYGYPLNKAILSGCPTNIV